MVSSIVVCIREFGTGTKWCGHGNIADGDEDLGPKREVDICCRDHDKCPDIIEGNDTKHNLTNSDFYTRLHCDCDNQFLKCLKNARTKSSNIIGKLYFGYFGNKCFRRDYPIKKCAKYYPLWPRCQQYELDESKPKEWQWFDNQLYEAEIYNTILNKIVG